MIFVTPVWEVVPSPVAQKFVKKTIEQTSDLPHIFMGPDSLDTTWYRNNFPESRFLRFSDRYFESSQTYSRLLTDPQFYATFGEHEFITICQTDAVLIDNPGLVDMAGLDYLGAPWDPPLRFLKIGKRIYVTSDFRQNTESRLIRVLGAKVRVGNGGLSIRRTSAHIRVCEQLQTVVSSRYLATINEDAALCSIGQQLGLSIATQQFAESVFMESQVRNLCHLPEVTGFHAIERWNPKLAAEILDSIR